jgi:glyoxylase I family protein
MALKPGTKDLYIVTSDANNGQGATIFHADFVHVAISCPDLERSVRFYESLGLKVLKRVGEVTEDGIARGFQLPAARLTVAYLAPPNASSRMFIDLVQWLEPAVTGEPYPVLNHLGINRIAFRVSDLDATTAALRDLGITFLTGEPQIFGEGIRCIVTTDPDGVFIQLIEGL